MKGTQHRLQCPKCGKGFFAWRPDELPGAPVKCYFCGTQFEDDAAKRKPPAPPAAPTPPPTETAPTPSTTETAPTPSATETAPTPSATETAPTPSATEAAPAASEAADAEPS